MLLVRVLRLFCANLLSGVRVLVDRSIVDIFFVFRVRVCFLDVSVVLSSRMRSFPTDHDVVLA